MCYESWLLVPFSNIYLIPFVKRHPPCTLIVVKKNVKLEYFSHLFICLLVITAFKLFKLNTLLKTYFKLWFTTAGEPLACDGHGSPGVILCFSEWLWATLLFFSPSTSCLSPCSQHVPVIPVGQLESSHSWRLDTDQLDWMYELGTTVQPAQLWTQHDIQTNDNRVTVLTPADLMLTELYTQIKNHTHNR